LITKGKECSVVDISKTAPRGIFNGIIKDRINDVRKNSGGRGIFTNRKKGGVIK
jgi:hypothetical protein